jgi:hypothetical protein
MLWLSLPRLASKIDIIPSAWTVVIETLALSIAQRSSASLKNCRLVTATVYPACIVSSDSLENTQLTAKIALTSRDEQYLGRLIPKSARKCCFDRLAKIGYS